MTPPQACLARRAARSLKELQVGHFTVRVLVLLAADEPPFDLPQQGCPVAAVENLRLDGGDGDWSRLLISLTARAGSVARSTDRAAAHRGTSGRCSQRIAWSGDTPFGDASEPGSSPRGRRARRQHGFVTARLLRDAKAVDWSLSILPAGIEDIWISARVDSVERLPGDLEAAFGAPLQGT